MNEATDDDPETWWVCLRPEGDGPPMPIRVRRFVKSTLRSYRLWCICYWQGSRWGERIT